MGCVCNCYILLNHLCECACAEILRGGEEGVTLVPGPRKSSAVPGIKGAGNEEKERQRDIGTDCEREGGE